MGVKARACERNVLVLVSRCHLRQQTEAPQRAALMYLTPTRSLSVSPTLINFDRGPLRSAGQDSRAACSYCGQVLSPPVSCAASAPGRWARSSCAATASTVRHPRAGEEHYGGVLRGDAADGCLWGACGKCSTVSPMWGARGPCTPGRTWQHANEVQRCDDERSGDAPHEPDQVNVRSDEGVAKFQELRRHGRTELRHRRGEDRVAVARRSHGAGGLRKSHSTH